MGTIFSKKDREKLINRVNSLKPDTNPKFGSLSPQKAVCHLTDSLLAPIKNEFKQTTPKSFYTTKLGQWFVISSPIPWPKGKIKISKELEPIFFKTEETESFEKDKNKLIETIELFATKEKETFPNHPIFGNINNNQWSKLNYRHIDHHLKQFGA